MTDSMAVTAIFWCVPFDVCRGILADSIVAKIFDGIGWADAIVAWKYFG